MSVSALTTIFIGMLGLGLGSFLNVVVLRVNAGESIRGRSHCPHCRKQLPWFTLIPIFSYIFLRGRCLFCQQRIAWKYFFMEFITAACFVITTVIFYSEPIRLAFYLIISALCIALFLSDYLYYTLPDVLTITGIIIGVAGQILLHTVWWHWLLGWCIGGGIFAAQYIVSRGRWVGSGDIMFGSMMGIVLGWPNILVGLFLAYVVGGITVIPLLVRKTKGFKDKVPFGTFLAMATVVTILFGDQIVNWYVHDLLQL